MKYGIPKFFNYRMNRSILFVANVDWFFISHRLVIAKAALTKGYKVCVACEDSGRKNEIIEAGIDFIDLPISRSGTNPINEIKTLIKLYNIYSNLKPSIVHHITLKPVIYGSIISRLTNVKAVVNAISGLGYNFTKSRKGFVQKVMIRLMKLGLNRKNMTIIFQNEDDNKAIESFGVLNRYHTIVKIKGSGVNLDAFCYTPIPDSYKIKILFPARMLWDKGVAELREATELLKDKWQSKAQFILCGMADTDNKAGVTEDYLKNWDDGNYVKWIGYKKEMIKVYQDSHIVVLPSYREGMPKSLLEASSIGRPIITTDTIGCKECVDEGINGFKVPVCSGEKLAWAIEKLLLDKHLIKKMGVNSRKKAEIEFDVNSVVEKHLKIYSSYN